MVIGKTKKDLFNSFGEVKEGTTCEILKVWLNNIQGDVYAEIKFTDFTMITSISNIEIIKK